MGYVFALFSALLAIGAEAPVKITKFENAGTQHRWALIEDSRIRYWQALSPHSVYDVEDVAEREREIESRVGRRSPFCPAGMARVHGPMKDWNVVIGEQNRACRDPAWDPRYLCTKFDPGKLGLKPAPTVDLDFCIDRYEFPNIPGEAPATMLSQLDAQTLCSSRGKRLCSENEWTFACEGPEALPYPYGYDRYVDPRSSFPDHIIQGNGCNIDVIRKGIRVNIPLMMRNRFNEVGLREIDKLWAGVPAGSREACVSPFGVFDLTGNIEEWTERSPGRPHLAAGNAVIKGGYWSPVESRCQPGNTAHGPSHAYYQTGFRCCSGIKASAAAL